MSGVGAVMALAAAISTVACAHGYAERDSDRYRDDSRALLASRIPAVKSCYDDALKGDRKVSGTVVVHFKVQPETGQVVEPQLDNQKTTAPTSLGQCVLRAVDGLKLDPPDANQGLATFAWEFRPRA